MKIIRFLIFFVALLCALVFYLNSLPPLLNLSIKGHALLCEIADTPKKRELGLMYRDSLGENAGMLFIYPNEEQRTFHMPHVKIPLSIVFANREGIIVHMTEMIVDETTTYPSEKEAMYALEANKGWFTAHQIAVGDKIEGIISQQ